MKTKEVVEIHNTDDLDMYEFYAKNPNLRDVFLCSDDLKSLKKEIKYRGWRMGWIATNKGCFSYGQNLVDEYPYVPKYPRHHGGRLI